MQQALARICKAKYANIVVLQYMTSSL